MGGCAQGRRWQPSADHNQHGPHISRYSSRVQVGGGLNKANNLRPRSTARVAIDGTTSAIGPSNGSAHRMGSETCVRGSKRPRTPPNTHLKTMKSLGLGLSHAFLSRAVWDFAREIFVLCFCSFVQVRPSIQIWDWTASDVSCAPYSLSSFSIDRFRMIALSPSIV
jgi:hypothetical protein